MNHQVNSIAGRLSLRQPQRRSLELLDRICEIVPLSKNIDVKNALSLITSEFPSVTDFERDFVSLCFALATGVGKTRLMGAFISYLHTVHGINNFFVLAPNLTIYNKLVTDFTPSTPKYVFKGIAEFATETPELITGDNYEARAKTLFDELIRCKINIFNISKINTEVRGGKSPKIKRLSEYIGESYFDYLASQPDLVLLMDESHRYRASAGVRAINELKPILGLELTATPFIETGSGPSPFKNVIFDYPLSKAMQDGFVKEPAVVTRKNFNPSQMLPDEIERLKLEDGIRLHEQTKVLLETYSLETEQPLVKPFLLVIARDTVHASHLYKLISHEEFFDGRYSNKVIQVDSSKSGAEEDEMIERLLKVEQTDEPTEIVIHVNMLKEGWDVTNLYTIVPLRAANARILIEQSIGRGLRLPFGMRTGVPAVDRLSIIAHDKFQEIIDEANRSDSPIRLQALVIDSEELNKRLKTLVSQSNIAERIGSHKNAEDRNVAQITYDVIRSYESLSHVIPDITFLSNPDIQAEITHKVEEKYKRSQLSLENVTPLPDIVNLVAETTKNIIQNCINIPRIIVIPKGVRSGFKSFKLSLKSLNYQAPSEELWLQYLRTGQMEVIGLQDDTKDNYRLEDYIVNGLVEFDDISYDNTSDLLYDLASQTVNHLKNYLTEDDIRKVLRLHQREIAKYIHLQMEQHFWEEVTEYEVKVSKSFTELKPSVYTIREDETPLNFRHSPQDKTKMAKYIFCGFQHCLYSLQKFQSDTERILAVILDRDSMKWLKPANGQFQIFYKSNSEFSEYNPDFVAETDTAIFLLEPKSTDAINDDEVKAKSDSAVKWCHHATEYTAQHGGKPWQYILIPHDVIKENMTLDKLTQLYKIE